MAGCKWTAKATTQCTRMRVSRIALSVDATRLCPADVVGSNVSVHQTTCTKQHSFCRWNAEAALGLRETPKVSEREKLMASGSEFQSSLFLCFFVVSFFR